MVREKVRPQEDAQGVVPSCCRLLISTWKLWLSLIKVPSSWSSCACGSVRNHGDCMTPWVRLDELSCPPAWAQRWQGDKSPSKHSYSLWWQQWPWSPLPTPSSSLDCTSLSLPVHQQRTARPWDETEELVGHCVPFPALLLRRDLSLGEKKPFLQANTLLSLKEQMSGCGHANCGYPVPHKNRNPLQAREVIGKGCF